LPSSHPVAPGRRGLIAFRIEPGERDKVLVEKLADRVSVAATRRADHPQTYQGATVFVWLRQQFPAARKRHHQLFAEAGYAIQQGPNLVVGNAEYAGNAPRYRADKHGTPGEEVDVA
jgi:hypothetical protein